VPFVVAYGALDAVANVVPLRACHVLAVQGEARLAIARVERGEVGASHCGPAVRHARAHLHAHAEHLARALANLEEHHVHARRIGCAERDGRGEAIGELLHERPRNVANVERAEVRVSERQHADRERIAPGIGGIGEVARLREREGEAAHRGFRQARARGDLRVAELAVLAREAAQDLQPAREGRHELAVLPGAFGPRCRRR
jgi:hypothetical protein